MFELADSLGHTTINESLTISQVPKDLYPKIGDNRLYSTFDLYCESIGMILYNTYNLVTLKCLVFCRSICNY